MIYFLAIYLLLINALGFSLMLADKQRAKKNAWRIPEKTLLSIALAGGSFGTYAGMRLFRHKTLHLKFSLGVPVMLALHIAVLSFLIPKLI